MANISGHFKMDYILGLEIACEQVAEKIFSKRTFPQFMLSFERIKSNFNCQPKAIGSVLFSVISETRK